VSDVTEKVVVLADDNEDMRFLTADALKHVGAGTRFRLEEASSGEEALARIATLVAHHDDVLLVSDNRMPGMTGAELCHAARARNPSASLKRVIITSAEPQPSIHKALLDDGVAVHVRPFQLAELRDLMGRVVGEWLGETRS
jgi:CheY-like chemotaxis protein